jgi:hypothetical protein
MTGSAGFDSGCGASGSVVILFVSSGRGTDVATGVLWDEPNDGTEVGDSAESHAISGGGRSSEGVRKPSFKGSASSGDETRRLLSVGDSSVFTVIGDS